MRADQRQASGHGEGSDRLPVLLLVLGRLSGGASVLPGHQEGPRKDGPRRRRRRSCVRFSSSPSQKKKKVLTVFSVKEPESNPMHFRGIWMDKGEPVKSFLHRNES